MNCVFLMYYVHKTISFKAYRRMKPTINKLLSLLGLRSDHPKILDFFSRLALENPPAFGIYRNQVIKIKHLETNWIFCFKTRLINDRFFPPKATTENKYPFYLAGITLYRRKQNLIAVDDKFWQGWISPQGTEEQFIRYFGLDNHPAYKGMLLKEMKDLDPFKWGRSPIRMAYKNLGDEQRFSVRFNVEKKAVHLIELQIAQHSPILQALAFQPSTSDQQAYLLLIKWLFDQGLLALPEIEYQHKFLDFHEIKKFVDEKLNGHLWNNQLTRWDLPFRRFLDKLFSPYAYQYLDTKHLIFPYLNKLLLSAAGQWRKFQAQKKLEEEMYPITTYKPWESIKTELPSEILLQQLQLTDKQKLLVLENMTMQYKKMTQGH